MRRRGISGVCAGWAVSAVLVSSAFGTALDDYVKRPDPAYRYELVSKAESGLGTGYVLEMVSQTWRSSAEVDRTEWRHWVQIAVPKTVRHETALIIVDGGSNRGAAPQGVDGTAAAIAAGTQSVVARVRMVPNQPLWFSGEDRDRYEDAIIAYSWDRFIKTEDADWPVQLPMVKSVVRAMDTVQEFVSKEREDVKVKAFVVTGASKRGWTAWLTAAVDPRVAAIAPVVIDMLNARESFRHHRAVYGFYSQAVQDYEQMEIFARIDTPDAEKLLAIVDPYEYRDRLTMPKFIVNSAGDEFFLPDSWQFYYDDLKGEKYLRYVPNSGHALRDTDAMDTVVMFYQGVLNGWKKPRFDVSYPDEGTIIVRTVERPKAVRLWQATNPEARDFRLNVLGNAWNSVVLKQDGQGRYAARVEKPDRGFTAFLMELTFESPGAHPWKFTTGTRVIPDVKESASGK